jgi:hypothetical protein
MKEQAVIGLPKEYLNNPVEMVLFLFFHFI